MNAMKLLNKYTAIICLFVAALTSCESPDLAEGRTDQVKGIVEGDNQDSR